MLTIDVPLTGGMGNVVAGGAVTTGVLVLGSLLLHATIIRAKRAGKKFLAQRRKGAKENQGKIFASLRLCPRIALGLFVAVMLDWISFILFVWERFTGHAVLTFNPPAKIDELAALRTEGTKGVVFPLGRLTAGWAFHESPAPNGPTSRAMPVV